MEYSINKLNEIRIYSIRIFVSYFSSNLYYGVLILPTSAFAQTAAPADEPAAEENEIVVSGYRAAIETSISLKRESPVIAEAFSAEDVGKLPDVSIAEVRKKIGRFGVNGAMQTTKLAYLRCVCVRARARD